MTTAALIFPHQMFSTHPALSESTCAVLVEEPLFFTHYRFHRQKLILHRASMKRFAASIAKKVKSVHYVEAVELAKTQDLARNLKELRVKKARFVDPCDDWLGTRLESSLAKANIKVEVLPDPHFLTPRHEIDAFTSQKTKLFFTEFYIGQRKRLGILFDGKHPIGGKWSFDPENRKKLPKDEKVPAASMLHEDLFVKEARQYVRKNFPKAVGDDETFVYPTDHRSAERQLHEFVTDRLKRFGDYEDAISSRHDRLFHSVLTPALNTSLLSPQQVVNAALVQSDHVPLNSLEGFIRQVIGWREFVRLVYLTRGRKQRRSNFWRLSHPVPAAFYTGTTGIDPVDHVIRRVLRTGYCHHIERLMVLGNFMLLCDIKPDAVYQWFMELFIDAYDWVMVPNVYGMSQHADGGLMTTKPYISGSSYILKMSDFKKGDWCPIWDALYWRFIDRHEDFFSGNPRMAVMVKMRDKLGKKKMLEHHRTADAYLKRLHA